MPNMVFIENLEDAVAPMSLQGDPPLHTSLTQYFISLICTLSITRDVGMDCDPRVKSVQLNSYINF